MKAFAALTTIELDVTLRWAARPRPPRPGAMVMAHYR
jgi:hypothetical protein